MCLVCKEANGPGGYGGNGGGHGGGDGGDYPGDGGGPPDRGPPFGNNHRDALDAWNKGIKRDQSAFPELTSDRHFNNFRRAFCAQAFAQDLANVLDPTYVPAPPRTRMGILDAKQQIFMYAVFTSKLKTPKAKALLRQHDGDKDARTLWRELVEYYQKFTGAVLSSQSIMQFLTTFRIGPNSTWKKSTHDFVLYFDEQVELYNTMQ